MVIGGILLGLFMIAPFVIVTVLYTIYFIMSEVYAMCGCEDCCGCCGPNINAPYGYAQNP